MAKANKQSRSHYKWRDEYYVEIYDLVRQGLNKTEVCEVIGVSMSTLNKWIDTKPALKAAIKKARSGRESGSAETFLEYVYKMLPPEVQRVWERLCEFEECGNSIRKAELLTQQPTRIQQHLFIHALVCSNFNASEACRKTNISKKKYENWTMEDPGFAALVEEVMWHKKNYFESALVGLAAQGDSGAIIFANKTINRDRGYDQKVEHTHKHSGSILHGTVDLDALELPNDIKRLILEAARNKQTAEYVGGPRLIEMVPVNADPIPGEDDD